MKNSRFDALNAVRSEKQDNSCSDGSMVISSNSGQREVTLSKPSKEVDTMAVYSLKFMQVIFFA